MRSTDGPIEVDVIQSAYDGWTLGISILVAVATLSAVVVALWQTRLAERRATAADARALRSEERAAAAEAREAEALSREEAHRALLLDREEQALREKRAIQAIQMKVSVKWGRRDWPGEDSGPAPELNNWNFIDVIIANTSQDVIRDIDVFVHPPVQSLPSDPVFENPYIVQSLMPEPVSLPAGTSKQYESLGWSEAKFSHDAVVGKEIPFSAYFTDALGYRWRLREKILEFVANSRIEQADDVPPVDWRADT